MRLSAGDDTSPARPFVTADASGRFHVIWVGPSGTLFYRSSNDGRVWSPAVALVSGAPQIGVPVASAGPDGRGWAVYTGIENAILAVPLEPGGAAGSAAFGIPDLRGITNPGVVRNGPTVLVAPRRLSVRSLRRAKCVRVRVQSTRPVRVRVAIFSRRRSIRLFGVTTVVFQKPGKRVVCIRVPLRAVTANIRQPFGFVTAYKEGAQPRRGEPAGRQKTRRLVLFP